MKNKVLTLKAEEIGTLQRVFQRQLILLFLFISFLFLSARSFGQCEMKFEYEVEDCTEGKSDGKIYVITTGEISKLNFILFQIDNSSPQLLMDNHPEKIGVNKILFKNLENGSYLVKVTNKGCQPIVLGDKKGIIVNSN